MIIQKNNNEIKTPLTLTINKNRCPENHPCPSVKVCPTKALSQQKFEAPQVIMDRCIQCGKCVKFCPMQALTLS